MLFKRVKIRSYEVGLYFHEGEFQRLLTAGRHWLFDPLWKVRVDVVSQREPLITHDKLDVIVKSGALTDVAEVVDLKDYERALVWIEAASVLFCRQVCTRTGPALRTCKLKWSTPARFVCNMAT